MIIAAALHQGKVSGHFGQSEGFILYETDGKRIITKTTIDRPEGEHGFLPGFLASKNVDVILAGGMGEGAVVRFGSFGIAVVTGVVGDTDDACHAYLAGSLASRGATCGGHEHHDGGCGHHHSSGSGPDSDCGK
jgi:predicted Fe-Mo cluster-binding NifX family protein